MEVTPDGKFATPGREGIAMPEMCTQKEVILVVDDSQHMLEVLSMILETSGFAVLQAASGAEAIELYQQHGQQISLVLLDVLMPQMDGPQTLDALRQIDPEVRCCFLTGGSRDYSVQDLTQRGESVVFKPFRIDCLIQHIRDLLAARK